MKNFCIALLVAVVIAGMPSILHADDEDTSSDKPTLGIVKIAAGEALTKRTVEAGADRKATLDQVVETLDGQLLDRMQHMGAFTLVARSDIGPLADEQKLAGGLDIPSCKYALVASLDEYQDRKQVIDKKEIHIRAVKRAITLGVVGKVYEVKSGQILGTTNFRIVKKITIEDLANTGGDATIDMTDKELRNTVVAMSVKIATALVVTLRRPTPADIVDVTPPYVTLDLGGNQALAIKGQEWQVFKLKEIMKNGKVLGQAELPVGNIKITAVNETLTTGKMQPLLDDDGQIVTDDNDKPTYPAITEGMRARLMVDDSTNADINGE